VVLRVVVIGCAGWILGLGFLRFLFELKTLALWFGLCSGFWH